CSSYRVCANCLDGSISKVYSRDLVSAIPSLSGTSGKVFQFAHCKMSNLTHDIISYLHYTMLIEDILRVCAYKKDNDDERPFLLYLSMVTMMACHTLSHCIFQHVIPWRPISKSRDHWM